MRSKTKTAVLLLTAVMFLASCGNQSSESKKDNTTSEQAVNLKYQCPMKCEGEKTYDKPGPCPVCNMDMKVVEESHDHLENDSTHAHD